MKQKWAHGVKDMAFNLSEPLHYRGNEYELVDSRKYQFDESIIGSNFKSFMTYTFGMEPWSTNKTLFNNRNQNLDYCSCQFNCQQPSFHNNSWSSKPKVDPDDGTFYVTQENQCMRTKPTRDYLKTWLTCAGGNSQGFTKVEANYHLGANRGGKMACVHGSGLVYTNPKRAETKFNYQ